MINYSNITKALHSILIKDENLKNIRPVNITRNQYLNTDEGNTPWIGVYRKGIAYKPRTLGRGARAYSSIGSIDIILQIYDEDEQKAEDTLEQYIKYIIEAVQSDLTLGATVDKVTDFDVKYTYSNEDTATLCFQWAVVNITFEVLTQ